MALNVTINGLCYLEDNTISNNNVKYQMLWYPNGTSSSPTTWNDVRVVEMSGYFSANLGDADFLTQEGVALVGGMLLLVFWRGDTFNRNSLCYGSNKLEEWGCTELVHDGSSTYTLSTQVITNISPVSNWLLPLSGFVGDSYTATNNSYDNHSWDFGGVTMHHYRSKYGEDIQLINTIVSSKYTWDDGSEDNVVGTIDANHEWLLAGSYNVELEVVDVCLANDANSKTIEIRNRAPVPNITCLQATGNNIQDPDTVVTFHYSGTDINNQITGIDWVINDTGIYGNTNTTVINSNRDTIIPHSNGLGTSWCGHNNTVGAFTNPGNHVISIVVYWNDGFNDLTINYEEVFNQGLFNHPNPNFTQTPPQATLSGTINFNNNTTNIERVGTGLPNCLKYDWKFTSDAVIVDTTLDVNQGYTYQVSPTSTDSSIELCANWNDGWQNNVTCVDKEIVFETRVTVTPEDCYYNMDIIGTSSDGTISGYSWEICKDTTISGGTGPWEKIWESPIGIDQKIKQVGFTEVGYFKVTGYVHGNGTTSDSETLYIHEVCPSSAYHVIWDGTGILDNGSDWDRTGFGVEASYAAHAGTNGLDTTGMSTGNSIVFDKQLSSVDANDYESITMWVNLQQFIPESDLEIKLHKIGLIQGNTLKLSDYINVSEFNKWQKVFINIEDFGLIPLPIPGHPTYVNRLRLTATGSIGFYLDDVIFSAGRVEKTAVAICTSNISTTVVGNHRLTGGAMIPNVRGNFDKETNVRVVNTFPKPKLS